MPTVRLREVLPEARPRGGPLDVDHVTDRSGDVREGSVFAAVRGVRADGLNFAGEAVGRGASCVLTDRPLADGLPQCLVPDVREAFGRLVHAVAGRPGERIRVFGVTGTDGKTTACWLLRQILRSSGRRVALSSTVEVCDGRSPRDAVLTTPGPTELARWLSRSVAAGATDAVVEVSSHALDQRRLAGLRLSAAAVTNVRRDHLDYHGTAERYAAAKARIADRLVEGGTLVLGPGSEAVVPHLPSGMTRVDAVPRDGDLPGRHNAENLAVAAAMAASVGVRAPEVPLSLPPGRMERIAARPLVLVDYAHTPAAVAAAVSATLAMTVGRTTVVCGAGGDRDAGKRPLIGEALSAADRIVLTSDNPRSEEPAAIAQAIARGIPAGQADIWTVLDRRTAIFEAIAGAGPEDAVLILGKGHETTQTAGGRSVPFDDREVAWNAIERAPKAASC